MTGSRGENGRRSAAPARAGRACWRVIFSTSSPTAQAGERGERAGRRGEAVGEHHRMAGRGWMWPMLPATLTTRPARAVAQGQIRCRAGQPSR